MSKWYKKIFKKADENAQNSLYYHRLYQGKIEIAPKVPISHDYLSLWYTPGVADVSAEIMKNKNSVFDYTNKSNTVAIVSNGTRTLGLGNTGPEAALAVMEGKSLLFKYLGGVDAFPICLDAREPEDIVSTVKRMQPTFGGINLEDIEKPNCYHVLEKLKSELDIPVWHDDQQGTALVVLAALTNSLKLAGKKMEDISISLIGAGAANVNVAKYLVMDGAKYKNMFIVDSVGILNPERKDVEAGDLEKWELCLKTNAEGRRGGIEESLRGSDVCIALSKPDPTLIKKEWVRRMADKPVVFACANPAPEIWPDDAKDGGAYITATGRNDFPNQINNSLGFPAVFRGALDVYARSITDEMCMVAAHTIAGYAEEKGISRDYILPDMSETAMYVREAIEVGVKAVETGVARKKPTRKELEYIVSERIKTAQKNIRLLRKR